MRIHQGLISWNDNGLAKCGKFFPGHVRSGDDRLKFISETFATLEVPFKSGQSDSLTHLHT